MLILFLFCFLMSPSMYFHPSGCFPLSAAYLFALTLARPPFLGPAILNVLLCAFYISLPLPYSEMKSHVPSIRPPSRFLNLPAHFLRLISPRRLSFFPPAGFLPRIQVLQA